VELYALGLGGDSRGSVNIFGGGVDLVLSHACLDFREKFISTHTEVKFHLELESHTFFTDSLYSHV